MSVHQSWDDLENGPLYEPRAVIAGHKVYRKEACTHDHRVMRPDGRLTNTVPARYYFGLRQCAACFGIVAPGLRRLGRVA